MERRYLWKWAKKFVEEEYLTFAFRDKAMEFIEKNKEGIPFSYIVRFQLHMFLFRLR